MRVGEKSIGILEVFSDQPDRFSASDERRDAAPRRDHRCAAVNRAARAENLPPLGAKPAATPFAPSPGSVLFASEPDREKKMERAEEKSSGGISLPRSHLIILICAAIAIFFVLGYGLAPLIQSKLQNRSRGALPTVLASSQPPKSEPAAPAESSG